MKLFKNFSIIGTNPDVGVDILNYKKNCFDECNEESGLCPLYCGDEGLCCRRGSDWHEPDGCDGFIGGSDYHTCVIQPGLAEVNFHASRETPSNVSTWITELRYSFAGNFGTVDKICSENDGLVFYKGNGCTDKTVGSISAEAWDGEWNDMKNVKNIDCIPNDDARSVLILPTFTGKTNIFVHLIDQCNLPIHVTLLVESH